MYRHEIPTHLNVEDKAFAGLTMRQLMTLAVGLALAYSVANDLPLPLALRAAAGAVAVATALALVLIRPQGRPLEDWAFALARYWSVPRVAVWRPHLADPAAGSRRRTRCQVLLPPKRWRDDSSFTRKEARNVAAPAAA